MKIGIDASRCSIEEATGIEIYADNLIPPLIEILRKDGHEVVLYVTKNFEKEFDGVRMEKIPNKILWSHLGLGPRSIFDGVERLFIPSHVTPIFRPKNTFVYIHDVCFESIPRAYYFWNRWYLRLMTGEAARNSHVITHSKDSADSIKKYFKIGGRRIFVVPPAKIKVSEDGFSASFKKPYILFIGRIEAKKNLIALLAAFDKILNGNPEIQHNLVLLGKKGFGGEEIFQFHEKMKNKERIIFDGYADEKNKGAALRNAAGVVVPSLCEGSSMVLMESRSLGIPFAASACGAIKEAGGDKGIYTENNWEEALKKLIYNPVKPELWNRTWEDVAKEVAKIITSRI